MLFKSNKTLNNFVEGVLEKGFRNKGIIISSSKITDGVVLMKLAKTPIYYMYGWDNDDDYWLLSDN